MQQLLELRRVSASVPGAALGGGEVPRTRAASVQSRPGSSSRSARDVVLQCASDEVSAPLPRIGFCCLGALTLLGWNVILAFTPDFQAWNPGWAFWCSICNSVLVNVVQGGLSTKAARDRVPLAASYAAGCVLTCVSLLGLVLLRVTTTVDDPVGGVFVAALGLVCIQGASSALLANVVFALAGSIHPKLTMDAMVGQGVGGVFAAAVGFAASGSERGFCISFAACVLFGAASIPFYCIKIQGDPHVRARGALPDGSLQRKCSSGKSSSIELLRKGAYPQCFTVCFVFVATFAVFPGVASKWRGGHGATQIAVFQLMDVVGRFAPHLEAFNVRQDGLVTWLALLRGIFVPAFFAVERSRRAFATDLRVQLLLMAPFAFTNGWVSTLSMMLGPGQRGLDADDAAPVGSLMSFFLVLGILLGSLLGLASEALLQSALGPPPGAGRAGPP